jgi:CheY-like chemotaxis protein
MPTQKPKFLKTSYYSIELTTLVHEGLRYYGELVDFFQDIFTISMSKTPALGHVVQFKITDQTASNAEVFKGAAKILHVTQPAKENPLVLHVTLKVVQADQAGLDNFNKTFSKRHNIHATVKAMAFGVVSSVRKLRSYVQNALLSTGAIQFQHFDTTAQAEQALTEKPLDCLIADWDNETPGSGMQLVRKVRKLETGMQTVCMLLSPKVTAQRIAQTVESEADEFVALPFTNYSLQEAFWRGLKRRKFPTPYLLSLRNAERLIQEKKFANAAEKLTQALLLDPHPASAHYYLGYIYMINNHMQEAMSHFDKGLAHKPRHLKCLFGKTFLLKHQNKIDEYYFKLKEILELYPGHPNSVNEAFSLAIQRGDLEFAGQLLGDMIESSPSVPRFHVTIQEQAIELLNKLADHERSDQLSQLLKKLNVYSAGQPTFFRALHPIIQKRGWDQFL